MLKERSADRLSLVVGCAVNQDSIDTRPSLVGLAGNSKLVFSDIQIPRPFTVSVCQARRQPRPERYARRHVMTTFSCQAPLLPHAIDWQKLTEVFAFFLNGAALPDAKTISGVMGEFVWIRWEEDTEASSIAARPALIVYPPNAAFPVDRIETVPHLAAGDPLVQHIALVLQAEIDAKTAEARVYAESLADALAIHFLRRYAAATQGGHQLMSGLPPYKLQRVIAYINEHLEQDLSLSRLAAAAQTSVAYFARLFKQTTGSSPHHYVLLHRIEHAKRLLTETDLPLSEVALRAGLADQSHLTAVFRRHVASTPKAYRDSTKSG